MAWLRTVALSHNRIRLALHQLSERPGRPLLVLHGLGERTPPDVPAEATAWPGPVWGLDFTGHGRSTVPRGGGYTCEVLMADTDLALAHLGQASLYGRGLGGYVALLAAGARPDGVRGVVIADGPGLAGGDSSPSTVVIATVDPDGAGSAPPDPLALRELSLDVRPPDYALGFAREAVDQSGLEAPLVVSASDRPPWLAAVLERYGIEVRPVEAALAHLAALPSR